jgi:hypothetical protein
MHRENQTTGLGTAMQREKAVGGHPDQGESESKCNLDSSSHEFYNMARSSHE